MSLKGKIGPEEKIQAVEDYLEMRKGSTQVREELGIRLSSFQAWLRKYQTEGAAGLHPKKGFTRYLSSLRLEAVEGYLDGGGSLDAKNIQETKTLEDPNILATLVTQNPACQYGLDGLVLSKAVLKTPNRIYTGQVLTLPVK